MSHDVNWDVDKYKEEHESEDQWQLRKAFLMKWKDQYPEERLVCLARVFINMEFMGCLYPREVMLEVSRLSADIAKQYRNIRKMKLQRTFVSASDAAEDKVRSVKRVGGKISTNQVIKSARIEFVPQSQNDVNGNKEEKSDESLKDMKIETPQEDSRTEPKSTVDDKNVDDNSALDVIQSNAAPDYKGINYMEDLSNMTCLDPRDFNETMLNTPFGQFVLIIRPWTDMINNLHSTCAALKMPFNQVYENRLFTVSVNHKVVACVPGTKLVAKATAGRIIWNKLRHNTVVLFFKEQWVTQDNGRISINDMADKVQEFGKPIEEGIASNMMKLMGWKGGGLGPESQGISEPIRPNLRLVHRAGLGHEPSSGIRELKRAGLALMRRRGITLDADLVFASDFSADERAVLHKCANQCGLSSKSYGKGVSRFLVVSNKIRPLALVRTVLDCGGETRKYRVFIPATVGRPDGWNDVFKEQK